MHLLCVVEQEVAKPNEKPADTSEGGSSQEKKEAAPST